jgi:hypothetical protein
MFIPPVLLLSSVYALVHRPDTRGRASVGEISPCGELLQHFDGQHSSPTTSPYLESHCTGNAYKASWIAEPFLEDGTLVLCGTETSGIDWTKTEHEPCPTAPSRQQWFSGRFDVNPVDAKYGEVTRTLCDGYTFWKGQHQGAVDLEV